MKLICFRLLQRLDSFITIPGVVLKRKRTQTKANESQQKWKKSNKSEKNRMEVKESKRESEDVNKCSMESCKWL